VLIELVEHEMFEARIAWAKDGRAGLSFARNFDLERLNQLRPNHVFHRSA